MSIGNLTKEKRSELDVFFFLVDVLGYRSLKNVRVTKVPYLLEVLTRDFGIIS